MMLLMLAYKENASVLSLLNNMNVSAVVNILCIEYKKAFHEHA